MCLGEGVHMHHIQRLSSERCLVALHLATHRESSMSAISGVSCYRCVEHIPLRIPEFPPGVRYASLMVQSFSFVHNSVHKALCASILLGDMWYTLQYFNAIVSE